MGLDRHKPFVVTLELSTTPMSETEALAREKRLKELGEQAVLSKLKLTLPRGETVTNGEEQNG